MACFLVPATEAVITTVATQVVKAKEKGDAEKVSSTGGSANEPTKIQFSTKLSWLNKLLWGGSVLLAFEHLWSGEVIPVPPFLTAVENGETSEMLAEMGSVGVTMAILITVVWLGMLAVSAILEKRTQHLSPAVEVPVAIESSQTVEVDA